MKLISAEVVKPLLPSLPLEAVEELASACNAANVGEEELWPLLSDLVQSGMLRDVMPAISEPVALEVFRAYQEAILMREGGDQGEQRGQAVDHLPPFSPASEERLKWLSDVGFGDRETAAAALKAHGGDVKQTVKALIAAERGKKPQTLKGSPPEPLENEPAPRPSTVMSFVEMHNNSTTLPPASDATPPPPPPPAVPALEAPPVRLPPPGSHPPVLASPSKMHIMQAPSTMSQAPPPVDLSLSTTSVGIMAVQAINQRIVEDLQRASAGEAIVVARELVRYNFTLKFLPPSIHREVLEELCDMGQFDRLTAARVINWHHEAAQLVPLWVRADGNCLLHACCKSMWGIQDSKRTIRRILFHGLLSDPTYSMRWRQWETDSDRRIGQQANMSAGELQEWVAASGERHVGEWEQLVEWAAQDSASLTNLHVFVLANILRRPILVI